MKRGSIQEYTNDDAKKDTEKSKRYNGIPMKLGIFGVCTNIVYQAFSLLQKAWELS